MNILLCAYACEPNKGSEPEVGWQMVNYLAKEMPENNFYVITRRNNKEAIENEKYPSNIKFLYYDLSKKMSFWKKGGRGVRTYYYLWMLGAVKYIKSKKIDFDIIHHITFVNDWLPSHFILLKNKNNKFIWGPIGSHEPIDKKFLEGKRILIEKVRIFLQRFFRTFDPFFHLDKNKSDLIVGINENVKNKLKLKNDRKFISEPAIAMKQRHVLKAIKKKDEIFRVISVGRLVYIKNFKLTILVFNEFLKNNPQANAVLDIVGDGEDREYLKNLVKELNIEKNVNFVGKIHLKEVYDKFSISDVFLFPTLENAGFVILEAMSYELPVLALNYGGPKQFIKSNINYQLTDPNLSYDEIVNDLAKKLEYFYKNEDVANKVGKQNKQDLLENFTWEAKAKKFKKIYERIK